MSLLALSLIEYGRWQSNLRDVSSDHAQLHRAIRLGERQIQHELSSILEDTGYITQPYRREWSLNPNLELSVEVTSLNQKLNLNVLNDPGRRRTYRKVVEETLVQIGYPRRTVDEIINWIEPQDRKSPRTSSRYGGYGYREPHRELKHLDELALVSGFRQRGIDPILRAIFTVHGSGRLNVNHLSPELWQLLRSSFPERLPALPGSVQGSREALRSYLTQPGQWEDISQRFPFLTRSDDSFRVLYHATRDSTTLHRTGFYRYISDDTGFETLTMYDRVQSPEEASSLDELL